MNKNKIPFGTNVYYYNWSELKIYNKRATYNANRIPNEVLVKEHKYCDLQYFYNCVKLYYSKDGYKRLVFCELENGSIITRLQSLDIYTSDIPKNTIYCAEWKTISGKGSFYSNVDCAIKEYKNEIDEFLEVDIAEIDGNSGCVPERKLTRYIQYGSGGALHCRSHYTMNIERKRRSVS